MTPSEEKFVHLTTAPIPGLIRELAIPTMISMLVSSIYNLVDTYFISSLGTSASAAIGIAFSFMAVLQAIGFFFGQGSGIYISRELGQRHHAQARHMGVTGVVSAMAMGVLLILLVVPNADLLARALGSTPTILPYASTFLRVLVLGAPFQLASLVLNNQQRYQGNARYAMLGILSGVVLNCFLEPLFIFTLDLGIGGAAGATALSQLVSFCVLLHMTGRHGNLPLHFAEFRPDWADVREILANGSPSLVRQGIESLGVLVLNHAASTYGDAAIAGMAIVTRAMFIAAAINIGIGQGFQPVCGFNYGAGIYTRVRAAFWYCARIMTSWTLLFSVAAYLAAPQVVALFRNDPEVVRIGTLAMRAQALIFWLMPFTMMCNMMLQTARETWSAIFLAASRKGLFLIPILLVLEPWLGLRGVVWAQPVADTICLLASSALIYRFLRRLPAEDRAA